MGATPYRQQGQRHDPIVEMAEVLREVLQHEGFNTSRVYTAPDVWFWARILGDDGESVASMQVVIERSGQVVVEGDADAAYHRIVEQIIKRAFG